VDQATYDRMSIGERYQYARQFPQGADALPRDPPASDPVAPAAGDAPPAPAGEKIRVGQYEPRKVKSPICCELEAQPEPEYSARDAAWLAANFKPPAKSGGRLDDQQPRKP
jgi:hypothetical protein